MTKVVLITGASSGFGEAAARKFAQDKCKLILAARSLDKLRALASELSSQCVVHVAALDVTKQESVDTFMTSLPADFRNIDLLVNNAGLALGLEPAHLVDFSDWETMVDTNIKGLLRMTRAVLPIMVERNTGHIINIGSTAGNWPYPGGNTYGGTKAFVQNFSRGLRADLLGKRIRVTCIEPGMSETNFSNVRFKGDDTRADKVYEGTKPLSAEDVAEIIYWVNAMPAHVNVNTLEVMPTCQTWSGLAVSRTMEQ
ncbi:MAG: SDR family oxidoreductase [Gammaproteobacteria bacterium]|nr:SDR family oxidoreductase [Gammaproteobacteria bacterium]MDP2139629.1 SDR family oxidoreductase [Gammaproteobacteria bacterium]MDP2346602.1 SDR family oxidoreductase [Gammaproteobacteria bacterium]